MVVNIEPFAADLLKTASNADPDIGFLAALQRAVQAFEAINEGRTMPRQLSLGSSKRTKRPCLMSARRQGTYSVMILSAHSASETKIFGLPNFAPYSARSVSVTPLAREHAPQA